MRLIVRSIAAITFITCILWIYNKPAWDSICTALGALGVLAATFLPSGSVKKSQSQNVGNGSIGIQAGKNVSFGKKPKKRR